MSPFASLTAIAVLLAAMAALTAVEFVIPLAARGAWGRRHLGPNLSLTALTFVTNFVFNIPLVAGLVWARAAGVGLMNALPTPPLVAMAGGVLALDLAWYVTHRLLHVVPGWWRFHAVHHSDPQVDVTTTIRQHPGESAIRYAFLAAFGLAFGVSPEAFVAYRVWSALHGQLEHANIALPQPLDTAITWLFSSPNMHKIHHARDERLAGRNFTNIFSLWDRLGGTFTPSRLGRAVVYGLEGCETDAEQSLTGLLTAPFRPAPAALAAAE
jgi:sterol desaturase/sphingolipid hydroxylase (fatty acid hydroxylase superfamily)